MGPPGGMRESRPLSVIPSEARNLPPEALEAVLHKGQRLRAEGAGGRDPYLARPREQIPRPAGRTSE